MWGQTKNKTLQNLHELCSKCIETMAVHIVSADENLEVLQAEELQIAILSKPKWKFVLPEGITIPFSVHKI